MLAIDLQLTVHLRCWEQSLLLHSWCLVQMRWLVILMPSSHTDASIRQEGVSSKALKNMGMTKLSKIESLQCHTVG